MTLSWKELDAVSCEATGAEYDYHVRLEDGRAVIDVFNRSEPDADVAHVGSFEACTVDEGQAFCEIFDKLAPPAPRATRH